VYKYIFSKNVGQFGPKFQAEEDTHTNHSSCRKTIYIIDLSYGISMWAEVLSFCHNSRVWICDQILSKTH